MRNLNRNYNVIVVGAGAAGCLFSRNLAREGYSVCLVEKSDRNELSHDWWDGVDKTIFDDVGIAQPKGDELWKGGEFIIYSPLNLLHQKLKPFPDYVHLDRRKFNIRLLTEAIDSGVEFFDKTTVNGPIVEDGNDIIVGIRIQDLDAIIGRLVVDCSGYEGIIRSNIPFKTDFDKKIRREDIMLTYREMREKKPSGSYPDEIIISSKNKGISAAHFNQDKYAEFFGAHADISSIKVTPKEMAYELIEKYKDKLYYVTNDIDYLEAYVRIPEGGRLILFFDDAQANPGMTSKGIMTKQGHQLSTFLIFIGKLETNYLYVAHQKYLPAPLMEGFNPIMLYTLEIGKFYISDRVVFQEKLIQRYGYEVDTPDPEEYGLPIISRAIAKFDFKLDWEDLTEFMAREEVGDDLKSAISEYLDIYYQQQQEDGCIILK